MDGLGQSKTAQALFAVGVNARLKDRGIEAFGVHPGGIFTPLQRHLPNEEMAALGWTDEAGKPSERAAALSKPPHKEPQHHCVPPARSLRAWAGFIVKTVILPRWSPMTMLAWPACAAGRLTQKRQINCGIRPRAFCPRPETRVAIAAGAAFAAQISFRA